MLEGVWSTYIQTQFLFTAGATIFSRVSFGDGVFFCFSSQEGDEEEEAPVVVVQLGYGGGEAWGVFPEAGVGRSEGESGDRPSWKVFREDVSDWYKGHSAIFQSSRLY